MKIKVDKEADALYFRFNDAATVESEEVEPGVILDFDAGGQVVGVEFLGISKRATPVDLASVEFKAA